MQPKPQAAPEQTGGELAVAEPGYNPLGMTDTPNIEGQAQRLGDPRLQTIEPEGRPVFDFHVSRDENRG